MSGAVRRAQRASGAKRIDSGVREKLAREAARRSDEIAAALVRATNSDDAAVSIRATQTWLAEALGRPGVAEPSSSAAPRVQSMHWRPSRDGLGRDLWAVLENGQIVRVDEAPPGFNAIH
jgi:hypothetical protein